MGVKVKDFSIFLLTSEKIFSVLDLVLQDYEGATNIKEFSQLVQTLSKYFDVEDYINNYPDTIQTEWLFRQLRKTLRKKELLCADLEAIYDEVKPFLFRYVVKTLVDENGYFDSFSISAYKKVCKLLIIEDAFEFLESYTEGLRICRGKLKKVFIEKWKS